MPDPSSRVSISPALTDGIRVTLEKRKGPQDSHPSTSFVLDRNSPASMLLGPGRSYLCSEVGCTAEVIDSLALGDPGTERESKSWYVPWWYWCMLVSFTIANYKKKAKTKQQMKRTEISRESP